MQRRNAVVCTQNCRVGTIRYYTQKGYRFIFHIHNEKWNLDFGID